MTAPSGPREDRREGTALSREELDAIRGRVALLDEAGMHEEDGPYVRSEVFTVVFDDVPALIARVEELEQDARRLEWLFAELNDDVILPKIHLTGNLYAMRANGCGDFRGAIDAAMRFTSDAAHGVTVGAPDDRGICTLRCDCGEQWTAMYDGAYNEINQSVDRHRRRSTPDVAPLTSSLHTPSSPKDME